eukprot:1037638-Pleurochrysis_carterae.AAC.1
MGAKAAAARKGVLIPASPKGKAKKKSADEVEDEDQDVEIPPADKNTDDNNAASNREDKMDNKGKADENQDDQDQEETESTSGREANTPKIDVSDQTKVRRPKSYTHTKLVMMMILHLLHCDTRLSSMTDTSHISHKPVSHNTKQSANRTWFELAPTQTNPNKAYVLREQTAPSSLNTCHPQVFKIETAAKDRPRAKYFNTTMILNGICVHLGLSDNAIADTRGFAVHGDPRMGSLNVVIPPHYWERLE